MQEKELKELFSSFSDSEKDMCCVGMFPVSIMKLNLTNVDCSTLIKLAQQEKKIRY